jgi:hypothetical protein
MDRNRDGAVERGVRVQTVQGVIEGNLQIGPRLRTLDHLNVSSNRLLRLHDPRGDLPEPSSPGHPAALNRPSILFVVEVPDRDIGGGPRGGGQRAAVSLQVAGFRIRGFVHVPAAGDPMSRFDQERPQFLALTSASVIGADTQFATSFVAVNRAHIVAAQTLATDRDALAPDAGAAPVGVGN